MPVAIGLFQVFGTMGAQYVETRNADLGRVPLDWRGYALLLVGPAAIALRRRYPMAGLVATLAATCAYLLLDFSYGPVFAGPAIMIFSAVVSGRRRAAWWATAAFFLFMIAYSTWLIPNPQGWFHHTAVAAFLLLTLTIAEFYRARRERLAERKRVEDEEARRQASEERLTMAQELHDVLAHNISLIHVQASTALHLLDTHPEQARTALTTIKGASKDVLAEMRSVLSLLREGAPRSPTAGMDRLDELVERSGLPVRLEISGQVRPLPAGTDRAGYRIVQESLTNVSRHAPGSSVIVRISYGPAEMGIVVEDDGAGAAPAVHGLGGGNGIPGMRERAAALGGSLSAAPRPGGGFRVAATLPLPALDPASDPGGADPQRAEEPELQSESRTEPEEPT
ncbi:histidine kinase [Planotetraspora sp. A-T 1434]|uniref:sensor histidine kinase n=1 Tax=Planotetraspora sp. A-T 1434 TaxID=2979219 RepID=UPI0021BE9B39|nr:histidine kinase [Planotetraspora sp. A-T 1434]MCT9928937.1 histidine kinase [Planotetraspora sp. A-T 1434]